MVSAHSDSVEEAEHVRLIRNFVDCNLQCTGRARDSLMLFYFCINWAMPDCTSHCIVHIEENEYKSLTMRFGSIINVRIIVVNLLILGFKNSWETDSSPMTRERLKKKKERKKEKKAGSLSSKHKTKQNLPPHLHSHSIQKTSPSSEKPEISICIPLFT